MMDNWLIYGATGYTGALLAEEAVKRGHHPLLAGRSADKLRPLAERLQLDYVAADLSQITPVLRDHEIKLVLHAAGPFSQTSHPMLHACLEVGAHYLDITGEIHVFENTLAHDQAAQDRGVALISGVGFDIVPSDCLIRYVADQVTDPQSLEIVVGGPSISRSEIGTSGGTLKTNLEMIADGFVVRRDNKLVPVAVGAGLKTFRFRDGERSAVIIPWGDVVTAYRPKGIPNVTAYLTFPHQQAVMLHYTGFLIRGMMRITALRQWASGQIGRRVSGPNEQMRQSGHTYLYAQVTGSGGQRAEAWMETVEAYRYTVQAALNSVEHTLKGNLQGALSPSQAFGADFALEVAGTVRRDTL